MTVVMPMVNHDHFIATAAGLALSKISAMKSLLISIILLLPMGLQAQVSAGNILSNAAARALPAVVRVQSFLSDSGLAVHPQPTRVRDLSPANSGSGKLTASASGVILSANGFVITNAHVLAGGDSLNVILQDRRSFRAALVGTDDAADLALLKIPAADLPHLEPGDPETLQIGDPVLAIGSPLELTSTVTAGILSARYRSFDDELTLSTVNSFLQTDAAINEGMSGSALVDRNGQLIGINAAIVSPSGTFAGYSFAIPADLVAKAFRDLVTYHRARHGCLEGSFSDMDDAKARRLGGSANGVLVENLLRNGSGFNAGLRNNDVITAIDQRTVNFAAQLRELIAIHDPGDQVVLTVVRSGKNLKMTAILTENNDRRDLARRSGSSPLKQVHH